MIGRKQAKGNECIQFVFPLSNQRESDHGHQPYKQSYCQSLTLTSNNSLTCNVRLYLKMKPALHDQAITKNLFSIFDDYDLMNTLLSVGPVGQSITVDRPKVGLFLPISHIHYSKANYSLQKFHQYYIPIYTL